MTVGRSCHGPPVVDADGDGLLAVVGLSWLPSPYVGEIERDRPPLAGAGFKETEATTNRWLGRHAIDISLAVREMQVQSEGALPWPLLHSVSCADRTLGHGVCHRH